MDNQLKSFLYASKRSEVGQSGDIALADILSHSIARNEACEITGVLLATENTFIQFIEGPNIQLTHLANSIFRDPRHNNLTVLSVKDEQNRHFPKWMMADWEAAFDPNKKVLHILKTGALNNSEYARDMTLLLNYISTSAYHTVHSHA